MFDEQKLGELQTFIDKHRVQRDPVAENGATGGCLSSVCTGFIPQSDGSLIRVVSDIPDEVPGPGSYEPLYPTFLEKTFKFMKPEQHYKNVQQTPSSCDYTRQPRPTRLKHVIHPTDPYPLDPTPLSGELAHPEWAPKNQPQCKKLFPPKPIEVKKYNSKGECEDDENYDFDDSDYESLHSSVEGYKRDHINKIINGRVERKPSPDRYNPKPGMADFDHIDCSSSVFLSEYVRFPESTTVAPSPDAYTLPEAFGTSQTKVIAEPYELSDNVKRLKMMRESEEEQLLQESLKETEIKPKPIKQSPVFMSKTKRDPKPSFLTPSMDKYNISRKSNVRACDIRARTKKFGDEWYETSLKDTPTCTAYNVPRDDNRNKGGYISHIGHRPYEAKYDHPLAFRSVHSSLIKPSFNIHYRNAVKLSKGYPRSSLTSAVSKMGTTRTIASATSKAPALPAKPTKTAAVEQPEK